MRSVGALALAIGLWSWSLPAGAEALSVGPLLNSVEVAHGAGAGDGDMVERFETRRSAASMSFDFTPRNPLSLLFDDAVSEVTSPGEPAELRIGVARDSIRASRFAALGTEDGSADPDGLGSVLEIGGALHLADWVIGSGYAHAPLFGGEADLVSATLGYGPVQARLSFGQAERQRADTLDVLTLSTDLAAWSWFTLESDLAVGSADDRADESLAAGRLGIRLNF